MSSKICLTLLPLAALAATLPALVRAQDATGDLLDALRQGGLVLYIRHAQTEQDYADQVTADPLDCATQRVLSRVGWAQARAIGAGIARQGIPVGEVLASQYCRAWQTADLAFGGHAEDPALNFEPAEDYTEAQVAAMRDRVLPLLLAEVPAGTNRVIVGHDDPFEAATGIYPDPQDVTYVLRAADGAVEILGAIGPDGWPSAG